MELIRHAWPTAGPATAPSTFQEAVYDGESWGSATNVAPNEASSDNTGVVLLSDALGRMLLVTLDGGNTLQVARRDPNGTWETGWGINGTTARQSLAGAGCGANLPLVFWTEGSGSNYTIMGADLSSVFKRVNKAQPRLANQDSYGAGGEDGSVRSPGMSRPFW